MASALSLRAAPPLLLPEPKTMTLSSGHIMLGSVPAITVSDKSLEPLGEILANDLVTLYCATRPTVAVGVPKAGGIFLKLVKGNPKYDSIDAYTLAIDQAATVEGGSYQALAFGMMTLVQAVHKDDKGLSLPRILIEDDADRAFRSLQLDIRVGYHSPEYIRQGIDLMRFFKVRVLQLHTSETLWVGAAFESSNGTTDFNALQLNNGWTKNEMDGVIEYARARGVFLVLHNEMRTNDPFWRSALGIDFNKNDKFVGYVDEADGKGAYQWPAGDNLDGDPRFYWKTGDKQTYKDGAITFAAKDGKFTVKAEHPLGAVFYYLADANTQVAKLDGKQGNTWEMNIADIVKALDSAGNFSYMAVDVEGNEAYSFYVPPAAAK